MAEQDPKAAAPALGHFITLEGGEGAGKSTLAKALASRLEALGRVVELTREPGGSPKAERIRNSLLAGKIKPYGAFAEALMFSAARIDHVDRRIKPALARGAWVICDRFIDSTRVYQGALGAIGPEKIAALETVAIAGLKPAEPIRAPARAVAPRVLKTSRRDLDSSMRSSSTINPPCAGTEPAFPPVLRSGSPPIPPPRRSRTGGTVVKKIFHVNQWSDQFNAVCPHEAGP